MKQRKYQNVFLPEWKLILHYYSIQNRNIVDSYLPKADCN